ncbi:(2,3-dihydroxybenzoyl)adenylate synthase [Kiloniella sp. b19]|uniref:(2,3-dihydroxybenzoyl)adenylate synthase n=1 Tax=Kiloniella sp. GXU_MW_B19 TaxID=3141326 RepID=UPI0031D8BDC3
MKIPYTPWPEQLSDLYRQKGYWIDQPLTRILDEQVRERPDATALICGDRTLSYSELDKQAGNLASFLQDKGLGEGDTALVQLPNTAGFHVVFFGLLKAGVAPVNALFSHRALELSSYADQIKPKLLIASRQHELFANDHFISQLQSEQPNLQTVLLAGEENGEKNLTAVLAKEGSPSFKPSPSPADAVAFFQLSGGSTGTPKLIPRTHNDYDYSIRASAEICKVTPETRFLCALPAGHNFPLSSPGALGVFHAGGSVVMTSSPEPLICFEQIRKHQVTMAALVPSAVQLWLEHAEKDSTSLASLELLQVGGASFAETLARSVKTKLGCQLQQVFGMAEGLVNYTRPDDPEEQILTSQGRPISPDDEIRILDEDGTEVPDGQAGALATRGPYTFRGYFLSPEQNAKAFDQDGFYHSGDLVMKTAEGNLRVVGRIKDQINRGGEKVASEEVENLLLRHESVREAALVAIADERLGEKSCAFIVPDHSDLKAIALKRHLMDLGIAQYKLPDRILFIDQMPLTAVGKIDKKALRNQLAAKAHPTALTA